MHFQDDMIHFFPEKERFRGESVNIQNTHLQYKYTPQTLTVKAEMTNLDLLQKMH